jgi:galactose oxidase-like protein/Big-like domain-containing protein
MPRSGFLRIAGFALLALLGANLIGAMPSAYAATVYVGDATVEPSTDNDPGGLAEAFKTTGATTGTVGTLTVYVDASSAATTLVAGLYADNAGHPGALLTQGSQASPTRGAWNTLTVPSAAVTAGTTYWLAILGAGGSVAFRDRCCGGGSASENSQQANLTSLPAAWSSGAQWSDGPISFYAGPAGNPTPTPTVVSTGTPTPTFTPTATPTPSPTPSPSQVGQWSAVMNWPLVAIHAVMMHNGNVLLMDGWQFPNQTQVYNPTTQTMTQATNGFGLDLFCSAHVNLADGRVLVAGGEGATALGSPATTIFDPVTNTWSQAPNMHFARWYPTATELGDGRVVLISGQDTASTWVSTPEIYDPVANTWTSLTKVSTSQVQEPEYPLSYLLPSGKIFTIAPSIGQSFLLDPGAQTWGASGGTTLQNGSAAMYLPGKILYTGGGSPFGSTNPSQNGAQIIDLNAATPAWQAVAPMNYARYTHTLTLLPDGNVLAVGGATNLSQTDLTAGVLASEEWNPTNNVWTTLAPMQVPRIYHSTALLMPDGRVLVAGGGHGESLTTPGEYNAQYYSPPYLFNGARPAITAAPGSATYGSAMTVQTPDAASIASVSLVSLGADSHQLDFDQHFVPLTFTAGSGQLTVNTPTSSSVAPPGYYMLFILNSAGVPSVAAMVHLGAPVDTTPPTVTMTAPASGATITGSATLAANATDNVAVASVQFQVDGSPVGAPVTQAPYTMSWDSTTVANGSHTLSARATDTAGNPATATAVTVTVSNPTPVGPTVDTTTVADGRGLVNASVSTTAAGDLLLAFVGSDGVGAQSVTVSGGGLTWTLVKRANGQAGDAEIWSARAATQLTNINITATQAVTGYDESLTVVAFKGATGTGAAQAGGAASGAPSLALTTTKASSLVFGVGNDYDNAIPRTPGSGQTLVHQWLDTTTGDTFWAQRVTAITGAAGTVVTINDTAPTGDRWNLSIVEITSA